jgi:transposase-like protein
LSIREVTNQYRLNKWTEIVRERINSGKTVAEWCADHDIDPKRYYYWLRRVRAAACEALPSLGTGNNPIVPVNIQAPITGTTPMDQESSSDITIHLGAVTLEIRNNASAALIENTLRALQNVR